MNGRILVVDDEAQQREILRRVLAGRGHAVAEASCGTEAVLRLEKEPYDLVVSDLRMPGALDGMGLFRWLREHRPSVDAILVSGAPEIDSALEALRFGAWDYMVKPVAAAALADSVERCLRQRRALDGGDADALREAAFQLSRRLNSLEGLRSVLRRHLSRDVADELVSSPRPETLPADKRELSVLFADIRGFTGYCASRDPEDVLATLNGLLSRLSRVVSAHRGAVDKYTGDGLMAVFGAPRPDPLHAENAVSCAVEMLKEVSAWNRERLALGLPALEMGVGVNSGEAVAGAVGDEERCDYTVIGSMVNLASRLQERAGPGQVLLGPSIAAAVSGAIPVRSRGLLLVRGFSAPIAVFEPAPEQGEVPPRELGRKAQALR